jgi:hypothetical protein
MKAIAGRLRTPTKTGSHPATQIAGPRRMGLRPAQPPAPTTTSQPTASQPATTTASPKGPDMTTTDLTTGYAHMVDSATPATLRSTLSGVAESARISAADLRKKAEDLRTEAAGLMEKDDMSTSGEEFLAEAARLEETAEARLGVAAAYEDRASAA